jgi:hypothetical protein
MPVIHSLFAPEVYIDAWYGFSLKSNHNPAWVISLALANGS